jgi:hypothetical protein
MAQFEFGVGMTNVSRKPKIKDSIDGRGGKDTIQHIAMVVVV